MPIFIGLSFVFGGLWRFAFGHDWKPDLGPNNFFAKHARVILTIIGVAAAAGIAAYNDTGWKAPLIAAVGTGLYFSIGNGTVIRGPTDPIWPYLRALAMKYVLPALVVDIALWAVGYHTIIQIAGFIAAAGYWMFWEPFDPDKSPWNWKAEFVSGAAWFGALAYQIDWEGLL
jgi:hypothetical protein